MGYGVKMKMPDNFDDELYAALKITRNTEGCLTEREMRFLFLLAAYPTAKGEILEIGSFKGKSTVILARAARLAGDSGITAVDPLTSPSITDPSLKGKESGWGEFQDNLQRGDVADMVEFHKMFSYELANNWSRPIRLLWIDGDHTYSGAKQDFDLFSSFLSDGAIIAFHDALGNFKGPIKVFIEEVLQSDKFGPAGLCGTIGWAQHLTDKEVHMKYKREKLDLYDRLSKLLPFAMGNKQIKGINKILHKILRLRVPHSEIQPVKWINKVGSTKTA